MRQAAHAPAARKVLPARRSAAAAFLLLPEGMLTLAPAHVTPVAGCGLHPRRRGRCAGRAVPVEGVSTAPSAPGAALSAGPKPQAPGKLAIGPPSAQLPWLGRASSTALPAQHVQSAGTPLYAARPVAYSAGSARASMAHATPWQPAGRGSSSCCIHHMDACTQPGREILYISNQAASRLPRVFAGNPAGLRRRARPPRRCEGPGNGAPKTLQPADRAQGS